jgi:hypothetical protein
MRNMRRLPSDNGALSQRDYKCVLLRLLRVVSAEVLPRNMQASFGTLPGKAREVLCYYPAELARERPARVAKIRRPLDSNAVAAADDQIYAAHENDPRPNALFDADGKRLKLSATAPKQADLREEWCDLYQAALDKKKSGGDSSGDDSGDDTDDGDSDPPSGDNNLGDPVTPCTTPQWIKIRLIRLPEKQPRPQWWRPGGKADPYPSEPCTVELTNGTDTGALDANGASEHANLPAGVCSIHFIRFYKLLEQTLGPEDTWPEIQPIGPGAPVHAE